MRARLIGLCLFLLLACPGLGAAADIITGRISITNNPVGNTNSATIEASTRTWTNNVTASPGTLIQETNTPANAAIQLLNHLTAFPVSTAHRLSVTNATNVLITAGVGQPLNISIAGGWASVTYSTQTVTSPTWPVRVPFSVEFNDAIRTSIASLLVQALSDWSTQAFATNASAISNLIHRGAGPIQRIASSLEVLGTNLTGWIYATNGALTNVLVQNELTNRLRYIFVPTGINIGGTNGTAFLGLSVIGSLPTIVANGFSDTAAFNPVIWSQRARGAEGLPTNVLAGDELGSFEILGFGETQYRTAFAIQAFANANFSNATVDAVVHFYIGRTNSSARAEIMSMRWGSITNQADVYCSSNLTVSGTVLPAAIGSSTYTGTNQFAHAIGFSRTNNTTLTSGGGGVNLLDPGLEHYIKISGPAGNYSLDKITRGWDGRKLLIQKNDSFTLTIVNESGAGGGADSDRILTGTGGNLTVSNAPGFVQLIYDSAAARWGVISKSN